MTVPRSTALAGPAEPPRSTKTRAVLSHFQHSAAVVLSPSPMKVELPINNFALKSSITQPKGITPSDQITVSLQCHVQCRWPVFNVVRDYDLPHVVPTEGELRWVRWARRPARRLGDSHRIASLRDQDDALQYVNICGGLGDPVDLF